MPTPLKAFVALVVALVVACVVLVVMHLTGRGSLALGSSVIAGVVTAAATYTALARRASGRT